MPRRNILGLACALSIAWPGCAPSGPEGPPAAARVASRPSLDDADDVTRLFERATACVPHIESDGACERKAHSTVVLTVAPDGTITDAVVPNQGQLEMAELVCVAEVFRGARFTKLPRPSRFDLPFDVCR